MKTIANIITCILAGAVVFLIIMSVSERTDRSVELQSNLSSAVEETVEIMAASQKYSIADTNEYLADFTESLSGALDSDSEIEVEIIDQDMEKAMLSIRVAEIFTYPNGKESRAECEKTVILNQIEEEERKTFSVCFYVDGEVYKEYAVLENDMAAVPADPVPDSGTFHGWSDVNGYAADFTQPVTQDISYYAEIY